MHNRTVLWKGFVLLVLITAGILPVQAQIFNQPPPGSVYREFAMTVSLGGDDWVVAAPNANTNFGVRYPNPTMYLGIDGGALSGATRAEALLTVWGGHVGTTGKKISFNGHSNLSIPELQTTPSDGQCYMQQENIVIDVPLGNLQEGTNSFQCDAGAQTCYSFGWGQWGIYGVIIRVYYDPNSVSHVTGSIASPSNGASFGDSPTVTANVTGSADRVDFLAYYDGYDTDGDGVWQEYHHDYNMAKWGDMEIQNHVGTAWGSPWSVLWNNDLVPDQSGISILARIRGTNGIWYVTQPVSRLTLSRASSTVMMFKPYNVGPREWAKGDVDDGAHGDGYQVQNVNVPDAADAASATALIRTWHGADIEDPDHWVRFNDHVFPGFGDSYFAKLDKLDVPVSSVSSGENTFTFYSPIVGHHGIEILWPGPALVVRYGVPLPVQLASFTATATSYTEVHIAWKTLTETNNFGFEVQRSYGNPDAFATVANSFQAGHGTTVQVHEYSYTDTDQGTPVRYYRLKQTDLNGNTTYSEPVRVDVLTSVNDHQTPTSYALDQAYPNPFNPSTTIAYALPAAGAVRMVVMNQLGQEVRTLVNQQQEAGYHQVVFDAAGLASGVYFYRITAGSFVATKKVVLVR